jgi:hypothetical protein
MYPKMFSQSGTVGECLFAGPTSIKRNDFCLNFYCRKQYRIPVGSFSGMGPHVSRNAGALAEPSIADRTSKNVIVLLQWRSL